MSDSHATFEDFMKLDIRVGEVKAAEPVEKSEKLLSLSVDLGEPYGEVEILAGVQQWYSPEELIGNKMLFIANLEPRKMVGRTSNGMMMAVDGEEKPELILLNKDLANGSKVR